MVYYRTGKGKDATNIGGSIQVGPVKITRAKPNLAKQVKNVKKSVKQMKSKEELKYVDTLLNSSAIAAGGTLTLLNGLQLGDDVSNRQGNEITPTSVQFRCRVQTQSTFTDSDANVRHIIFWDSQANGAAPSIGDVLDGTVVSDLMFAPYKRQTQKRFKILYDKTYSLHTSALDPVNPTTQILSPVILRKAKRQLNRVVKYRNAQNTGVITDLETNSLYSLWIDDAGSSTNIYCGYRMYFKDD